MNKKTSSPLENFTASVAQDDGLRHKSVRGALFMAAGGAIEFVVRTGGIVVLARILRPEDFGLLAMVTAFTGTIEIFKDLGLGVAAVQRETITNQEVSTLFWVNALFSGLVTVALWTISPAISWFYGDDRLKAVTAVVATTIFLGGMTIQHEAILNRRLKQGAIAFIRLLATTLSMALGIALAVSGFGYWALVVREATRSLLYLLGVWYYAQWLPAFLLRLTDVKDYLRFGRDLTITNVLMGFVGKIDSILIGRFFGPGVLGVYQQGYNLIMLPVEQFNAPVFSVAQPGLSALQSDPVRYRQYFRRVAAYVSLLTMPLGIFAAVYSEELTLFILGEKWLSASPFLGVFAIAAAILPTLATSAIVLVTLGRSKVLLGLAFAHSLVLTLMMLVGLHWGALGVASAHVAASVCLIAPRLYYGFKGSPVNFEIFFSAIRMSVLSSVFMGVFLILFRLAFPIPHPLARLFVGCGVGVTTCLFLRIVLPAGRAELKFILHDVRSSLFRKSTSARIREAS